MRTNGPKGNRWVPYVLIAWLMCLGVVGLAVAQGESPMKGGTVRIAVPSDPVSWDTATSPSFNTRSFNGLTHSRLITLNYGPKFAATDYSLRGDLASEWKFTAPTTFVLKLRPDVKWQNKPPVNGRGFVCDDAKFSLTWKARTESVWSTLLKPISSMECTDNLTLKINLSEPYVSLPYVLAYSAYTMVPREAVEKFGNLNSADAHIGTGPWMLNLKESKAGVRWVLDKNPDYYRAKEGIPYIDRVEVLVMPDISASTASFLTGKLEFASNGFGIYYTVFGGDFTSLVSRYPQGKHETHANPFRATYVALKEDKPPFNDVRVRRAVSMAIDREQWNKSQYAGRGFEGRWMTEGATGWYLPTKTLSPDVRRYYEFHPDEAKKLLAEAGYANGLTTRIVSTKAFGPQFTRETELIVSLLRDVGVNVSIEDREYASYLKGMAGEFSDMYYAFGDNMYDPDALLQELLPDSVRNIGRIQLDGATKALLLAQRKEPDQKKRREIWVDIQRRLAPEVHIISVPNQPFDAVWQPWLRNFNVKEENCLCSLTEAWLAADAPGRK